MDESILSQVLPYQHFAVSYVQAKFGLDAGAAADVVQDVLVGLIRKPPETLSNAKRFFLRACRWYALQVHRRRRLEAKSRSTLVGLERGKKVEEAPEILIALEEEDQAKFYDGKVTLPQKEVLDLMSDGHSEMEVSTILELPASTVRMRVHLARKRLTGGAA